MIQIIDIYLVLMLFLLLANAIFQMLIKFAYKESMMTEKFLIEYFFYSKILIVINSLFGLITTVMIVLRLNGVL